ncbi:hypothetical protein F7Q99_36250 [Streptomyces kaniharaensis]|uniref:Uncharacterized protein n=1 Tax=Streptomyces kaniharaensis TaxID=212423 RepID=A0A6N7L2R8_9ACTN|nr:hypothetical protein [Streptomyces kaniharaensis]MQS17495.1 hypothetical protein [Streptomyces kaniharaensis]
MHDPDFAELVRAAIGAATPEAALATVLGLIKEDRALLLAELANRAAAASAHWSALLDIEFAAEYAERKGISVDAEEFLRSARSGLAADPRRPQEPATAGPVVVRWDGLVADPDPRDPLDETVICARSTAGLPVAILLGHEERTALATALRPAAEPS